MKRFPLGISGDWLSPADCHFPSTVMQDWLLHTGSLTERLQEQCRDFKVTVLGQGAEPISKDEATALYGEHDTEQQTQVREVILHGDGIPWVFARSLLPAAFVDNCMSEFNALGSRPLGQILFNDARFERQPFDILFCPKGGVLQRQLSDIQAFNPELELWGRRSVFSFQEYRLMVIEVFLPEAPAYQLANCKKAGALNTSVLGEIARYEGSVK